MNILSRLVDERFWSHRQRSTSIAGIACAEVAILLFMYRFYISQRLDWDLLAVALTFLVVKLALMTWYYMTK